MFGVSDSFVKGDQEDILSAYLDLMKAVKTARNNIEDWRKSLSPDTFAMSVQELEVFEEAVAFIDAKLKKLYPSGARQ